MSDDKESDERGEMDKNCEEILTNDIKVLKLWNLVRRNTDNIGK